MNEHENLLNPDNYKIVILQKKNRRKKLKEKYLTSDFSYSKNINDALIFENFQDAENILAQLNFETSKPRIIIKYMEKMENENAGKFNSDKGHKR